MARIAPSSRLEITANLGLPNRALFTQASIANPPGVGRRVAVVTTSQRMAERLQRLLTQDRGHAFFNLRFHTLHSLASEVLRSSGVPLPDVINEDLFHERLVEQLLVESGHFDARRARALAEAHRATVRDLLEAGVETSSFREYFSDMDIPGEGKLFRLLSLADRYRERLSSLNVAGSADLARLAAVTVENHPTALESYDELVYYGFYDLNGAQSDFFNAVAQQARVRLYFPCVKGQAGWAFAERFLELKIRVGGRKPTRTRLGMRILWGECSGHCLTRGRPRVSPHEMFRSPMSPVNGTKSGAWRRKSSNFAREKTLRTGTRSVWWPGGSMPTPRWSRNYWGSMESPIPFRMGDLFFPIRWSGWQLI
jgi:hypothetical protein